MKIRFLAPIMATLLLSACATEPDYTPAYFSENEYKNYNCNQLSAEMKRVSNIMEQKQQERQANNLLNTAVAVYAISQGYGVNQNNKEIDILQARYNAVDRLLIEKDCIQ
jgi:tellurite resistance protein